MQQIRKGFWMSEERIELIQRNQNGTNKNLFLWLKSLFKSKIEETSEPKK